MTKAIKISDMTEIDKTAVQILRVIALHLGENEWGYVDYEKITKSLNLKRSVVRSSINRMKERGILKQDGKLLSIQNAVLVQ